MRALPALALALVALAVAPAASPKGSVPSRACGAEGCIELDRAPESLIILDHDAKRAAPAPAPYYRIEYGALAVGPHYFVTPRFLAVETAGGRALQWYALNGIGAARLSAAIRDLTPYAAPDEWPTTMEVPVAAGGGTDVVAWLAGVLLVALAAGAIVGNLIRVRRPRTA